MYPVEVAIPKNNEHLYQLTKYKEEESIFFLLDTVMLYKWNTSCPRAPQSDLIPTTEDISALKRHEIQNRPFFFV